jgi:hypothetical protein
LPRPGGPGRRLPRRRLPAGRGCTGGALGKGVLMLAVCL